MLYYLMKHESCQWLSDTLIDPLADAGITTILYRERKRNDYEKTDYRNA